MGAKGAKTVRGVSATRKGVLSGKRFVFASAQDVNCNFPKVKVETCQSGLEIQGKGAQKPLLFQTLKLEAA